jgi:hypothetical protein
MGTRVTSQVLGKTEKPPGKDFVTNTLAGEYPIIYMMGP